MTPTVQRTGVKFLPDSTRVLLRPFMPGNDHASPRSSAA